MYADVLVELKIKSIDQTFTYRVPDNLNVIPGIRVLVPFGRQKLEGFVLKVYSKVESNYKLKDIIDVIDDHAILNEELLELGDYISKKTLCSKISAYQTMLPAALKAKNGFVINKKYITYIKLIDDSYIPKNENQIKIIELLKKDIVLKKDIIKISLSSFNTLKSKKIIEEVLEETYRINDQSDKKTNNIKLSLDQQKCVDKVLNSINKFKPFLLYGVTGSGKTEVYMNIISKVLEEKKQVIMLVPEISLTPQIVNLFKNRFGSDIAILHSALSNAEKYDEWRKVENGDVNIVIGARSAIFAPFTNIGAIIIDEEHSDTYKQENNPRYDTIDIAIKRAKTHACPIVLGSATPSIESMTRAKNNIYDLLILKNRINMNLPKVELIDMKDEIRKGNKIISEKLSNLIEEKLSLDEQVILLLNRRGYSTTITCKSCGEVIKCPNCEIPLTYHKKSNKLNCHYCNYTTFKPNVCLCGSNEFSNLGLGTEKLEEEVKNKFINSRVIRMDVDTTTKKGSHEKIINDFKNKKYNILIGTQMIAKGLDFKDVTLVGVINGDASLNIPDFRSAERTYDLLSQVAGRAGRSEKEGIVIIQGFNIDHYSIKCATNHDFDSFYLEEMKIRKKLGYPPYYNLTNIKLSSTDDNALLKTANKITDFIKGNTKDVIVLGPSFSLIPKINNKYYVQIILKYKNIKQVYDILKYIIEKEQKNKSVNIDIDVNPKKL